jgi:hypothetical protein
MLHTFEVAKPLRNVAGGCLPVAESRRSTEHSVERFKPLCRKQKRWTKAPDIRWEVNEKVELGLQYDNTRATLSCSE